MSSRELGNAKRVLAAARSYKRACRALAFAVEKGRPTEKLRENVRDAREVLTYLIETGASAYPRVNRPPTVSEREL